MISGELCPVPSVRFTIEISSDLLGQSTQEFSVPVIADVSNLPVGESIYTSTFKGVDTREQEEDLILVKKEEPLTLSDIDMQADGTLTLAFNKPIK